MRSIRMSLMSLVFAGLFCIRFAQAPLPPPPFPKPSLPPLPTTPPPESAEALLTRWTNTSLLHSNLRSVLRRPIEHLPLFSCMGKCHNTSRAWNDYPSLKEPRCFCDRRCESFQDCCYDYEQVCGRGSNESDASEVCAFRRSDSSPYGIVFTRVCRTEVEPAVSQRCTDVKESDIMTSLPVFDADSNTAYRNVFCAGCNNASNINLWSVEGAGPNATLEYDNLLQVSQYMKQKCNISYHSPKPILDLHPLCVIQPDDVPIFAKLNNTNTTEELRKLCQSYAFPLCKITPDGEYYWFKNPHCIFYHGILDTEDILIHCPSRNPPLPPMTIFFDFRSTTSFVISKKHGIGNAEEVERQTKECEEGQVFDPFVARCRYILSRIPVQPTGNPTPNGGINCTGTGSPSRNESLTCTDTGSPTPEAKERFNCSYVALNDTEYILYENGTMFVKVHNKHYPKGTYLRVNGTMFVCSNFTKGYEVLPSGSRKPRYNMNTLTLLSVTGCGLSVVSLLVLIFSYTVLSEMRNVPGQIVLSLAATMLVYHLLYFLVNQSDTRALCVGIAVCLHYSILSAFCWMNSMAFDLHWTFTRRQGPSNRSGSSRGCFAGNYVRYATYSWGAPLVIVIASLSVDFTRTWRMGYGSGDLCFINNPDAILYVMAAPVALILLYNTIALLHTMWHIRGVRKQTSKVTNQRRQPNLPIICLKMTSGMGVTWILGYIAATQATSFVWYAFVAFNSLQGFFIMASYVLNKRVLKMYREAFKRMRTTSSTRSNKTTKNTTPGPCSTKQGSTSISGPSNGNYGNRPRKLTVTTSLDDEIPDLSPTRASLTTHM